MPRTLSSGQARLAYRYSLRLILFRRRIEIPERHIEIVFVIVAAFICFSFTFSFFAYAAMPARSASGHTSVLFRANRENGCPKNTFYIITPTHFSRHVLTYFRLLFTVFSNKPLSAQIPHIHTGIKTVKRRNP